MKREPLRWQAPGRGRWDLETSHYGGRLTPLFASIYLPALRAGTASSFRRYGVPASHLEMRMVHNRPYMRTVPVIQPPAIMGGGPPPYAAAWLLSRLVPELRRRDATARRILDTRLWRADCAAWYAEREQWVARNLALQDEPLSSLDDAQLAGHVRRAAALTAAGTRRHFELVPATMMPAGDLAASAVRLGLDAPAALALLAGSSPASAAAGKHLAAVRAAVGGTVASLDDIRAAGPHAGSLLDRYLREFGSRVVSRHDVDGQTLRELPEIVVRGVNGSDRVRAADDGTAELELLGRLNAADRAVLADALREARATYGARDDNVGVVMMWPIGLLRRAALEVGRRLVERATLGQAASVFEGDDVSDVVAALDDPRAAQAFDERATRRTDLLAGAAPATLGPQEIAPPLSALPRSLGRVAAAMLAVSDAMYDPPPAGALTGVGAGAGSYRGRACVVADAGGALDALKPGDVLVCPFTTPAYNAVLPVAGALVVEHGGPLSHAAIVARELRIPAVIGVAGATTLIPQAAAVQVDASAGTVSVQ